MAAPMPRPFGPPPLPTRRPSVVIDTDIMYTNAVYYPSWRVYRGETPESLNFRCISHVFYAFARLGADGGVYLLDEYADLQKPVDGVQGCLGSFAAIKQRMPHLKVILSIGGGSGSQHFAAVAANAALRDNFGRSARALVNSSGLDGIDIDWEHPLDHQQGRDFLALLASARLHLPADEYILSAALPQWTFRYIDLPRANNYLDFLNLMAYDFYGPWTPTAGHHAQLHSGNLREPSGGAAVAHIKSTGFPSTKLLLGIPVYGRSFLGANGPGDAYFGSGGEEGTYEYKRLPSTGSQEAVDIGRVAAYCRGGDGGFISYDNVETVAAKARFCKMERLGGLFYWTGTADSSSKPRSLIEAGFRELHAR